MSESQKEFNFPCPKCTNGVFFRFQVPLENGTESECTRCHTKFSFDGKNAFTEKQEISQCIHCGCREFYIQKDFSRILGIGLIVVGCVLAPYTYYISLFALTFLDYVLYRRLGFVIACYGCEGVYRGLPITDAYGPFQLLIRDKYRFGKAQAKAPHSGPLESSL